MTMLSVRPGRAVPLVLSTFAVAAFTAASTVVLPAQEGLPPARAIIDGHVAAIGGRSAVLAHSSIRMTGTMSIPANGVSGSLEGFAAKPNRNLVRINVTGVGEISEGVNGDVAWSLSPMTGPMLAQGRELEQKKRDADFYAELRPAEQFKSVTTVEKTTWEGRPAYKVNLVRTDGSEEVEYYDVENRFRIGREFTRDTMMGTMKVSQVTTDYKKFGDLLHATNVKVNVMGVQQVFTIDSVEYDKVDPAMFEPPDAIKALIKK
jgi:hypothetical protein